MIDGSEQAFPRPPEEFNSDGYPIPSQPGLTIRQHFAAQAITGLCAERDECGSIIAKGAEWIAQQAVAVADALIAELNKGGA